MCLYTGFLFSELKQENHFGGLTVRWADNRWPFDSDNLLSLHFVPHQNFSLLSHLIL